MLLASPPASATQGTAEVADDLGRLLDEHLERSTPNTGLILSNDCSHYIRRAALDPQLPMTETDWASAMQREAAGHVRVESENQSQKIGCRSAVGRVGRQSTLSGQPSCSKAAGRRAIAFLASLLRSGRS